MSRKLEKQCKNIVKDYDFSNGLKNAPLVDRECGHYIEDDQTLCDWCLKQKYADDLEEKTIYYMGTSQTDDAYSEESVLRLIRKLTGE